MKLWTIEEIISITGFSESKVRRAVKSGELESRKVKGSRRVLHAWFVEWLKCDPLTDPALIITVSKEVHKSNRRITTTTKFQRQSDPTLFDI